MGLFDKLKNVFFEEEYVEVEEPEKEEPKEKVAVAKKIETPEFNEREKEEEKKEPERELREEKHEVKESLEFTKENDFKFPMNFDDKDFEVEKTMEIFEQPIKEEEVEVQKEEEEGNTEEFSLPIIEETREYRYEESSYNEPYTTREEKNEAYHGLYEGIKEKEEKPGFTPSPIISPIYGILNKNYKKEEIVTKREVRLSQFSNKKADLDLVREKAYGDLAGEITASIDEEEVKEEPKKEDLFYDLSDESPTVKTVTVGDAEEYFKDLGLEYNVDYKVEKDDVKPIIEEPVKEKEIEKVKEEPKKEEKVKTIAEQSEDDKNLFDLIDAMYDEKE